MDPFLSYLLSKTETTSAAYLSSFVNRKLWSRQSYAFDKSRNITKARYFCSIVIGQKNLKKNYQNNKLTFNKSSSNSSTDSELTFSFDFKVDCSLSRSSVLFPVVLKPLNFNSFFKSGT